MESIGQPCSGCDSVLTLPYIDCKECPDSDGVYICVHCFARGVEFGQHQNNHSYSVVNYSFPLYEQHWTAAEELTLLESMENSVYGNWVDASIAQRNKTAADCEQHYNKYYVNHPEPPLPKFPEHEPDIVPTPIVFKLSDDPPRPAEGSPLCMEMAGYSAPRGDFTTEHNNFAELDICHLTFDDDEEVLEEEDVALVNDLKLALLHSYQHKLRERHRRKRIVKDFGLIKGHRMAWFQNSALWRDLHWQVNGLKVFTPLMTPFDYDMLHEALTYEVELKNRICDLQDFRSKGLKRLRSIPLYKTLRTRRGDSKQAHHLLTDVINHIRDEAQCRSWLQRHNTAEGSCRIVSLPAAPRKAAAPLKIDDLPGVERLSSAERELCETARLTPQAFMEFSSVLIGEARKQGGLRLAQARTLIKIDVNKTRKIYDFLVQEGRINKV